jgi:hypothetical protein
MDRILCMSKFLFDVQQKNRLNQKGLLRRFSITCYGHQESVAEMREHKNHIFAELKSKKGTKEYDEWFLNYKPATSKSTEKKALAKKKRKKTAKKKSFLGIYYSTGQKTRRQKKRT